MAASDLILLVLTNCADCNLCRKMSGSVAQSWVLVREEQAHWQSESEPTLLRTTPLGRRHACTRCGGILSIVYDAAPGWIWLAGGAIDEADALARATRATRTHICCHSGPPWYALPNDAVPRFVDIDTRLGAALASSDRALPSGANGHNGHGGGGGGGGDGRELADSLAVVADSLAVTSASSGSKLRTASSSAGAAAPSSSASAAAPLWPHLMGMRTALMLWIVSFHWAPRLGHTLDVAVPKVNLAVTMFIVISGFGTHSSFATADFFARRGGGGPRRAPSWRALGHFYLTRARLLVHVQLVSAFAIVWTGYRTWGWHPIFVAANTRCALLVPYFHPGDTVQVCSKPDPQCHWPTWPMCANPPQWTAVSIYAANVLYPFVAFGMASLDRRGGVGLVALAILGLWLAAVTPISKHPDFVFVLFHTPDFLLGVLAAEFTQRHRAAAESSSGSDDEEGRGHAGLHQEDRRGWLRRTIRHVRTCACLLSARAVTAELCTLTFFTIVFRVPNWRYLLKPEDALGYNGGIRIEAKHAGAPLCALYLYASTAHARGTGLAARVLGHASLASLGQLALFVYLLHIPFRYVIADEWLLGRTLQPPAPHCDKVSAIARSLLTEGRELYMHERGAAMAPRSRAFFYALGNMSRTECAIADAHEHVAMILLVWLLAAAYARFVDLPVARALDVCVRCLGLRAPRHQRRRRQRGHGQQRVVEAASGV